MLGNIWRELTESYNALVHMISDYNKKIAAGKFLEYNEKLEPEFIDNIVAAHTINLLIDDEQLMIPNKDVLVLPLKHSAFANNIDWNFCENGFKLMSGRDDICISNMICVCFDESGKRALQEICAQDIVYGGELAKKIKAFLDLLGTGIEIENKGESAFFQRLSELRKGVKYRTKVQQKYEREYMNRGALLRNRVFKHRDTDCKITDTLFLDNKDNQSFDYREEKNFCQAALLHIGVESTGSSGTGFMVSADGYALTCAHVVEGAKRIYATIINNDGYPVADQDGFEVYDAGEGEVIYSNPSLDIALLKMNHFGRGFLPIEQREILPELGEEVVVFGYPLGYEMPRSNFFGPNISFYKGYVSSNQVREGNSVTFLDINVKSGNSGSPVISTKTGNVIGIMSGIKVGGRAALNEKMPYMIPIQHVLKLIK